MPAVSPISTITIPGFPKGLNTEADPVLLEEGESPLLENVEVDLGGAVRTRGGSTRHDDATLDARYSFIDVYGETASANWFICQWDGNNIHYTSGTTLASESTAWGSHTNRYDWNRPVVVYGGSAFVSVSNGTGSTPREFDGTTWTTPTRFNGATGTSHYPMAAHAVVKNERVYAANILYLSGTRHGSRLHWSNALLPKSWDAEDYIDFDPDDGEQITAIKVYGEDLLVFKDTKIYVLTGRSPAEHNKWDLSRSLGTTAAGSIVEVNGILYFFDPASGVYSFDGGSFNLVSDKINTELLQGMNQSVAYKAAAHADMHKLYLSVPWGTDTHNTRTYVLDTETGAWACHTVGYAEAVELAGVVYGTYVSQPGASGEFGISRLHVEGVDDRGSTFTAKLRTPWLVPAGTTGRARLRRADIVFAAGGGDVVTVAMYRNFYNQDYYRNYGVDVTGGGSLWGTFVWGTDPWGGGQDQVLVRKQGWGQRWYSMQFEVRATEANPFQLNRLVFVVSVNEQSKGERN